MQNGKISEPEQKWKAPADHECPICRHKGSWCQVSDDETIAMCRREGAGAYASNRDILGAEYFLHWLVTPPDKTEPVAAQKPTAPVPIADIEIRNQVYGDLLGLLELSAAHLSALAKRGLTLEQVSRFGYRTLGPKQQVKVAAALAKKHAVGLLLAVPGLFSNQKGHLSVCMLPGLLIPARDAEGRIVALVVRPDERLDGGTKYLWCSSKKHNGPGPGAPPHVSLGIGVSPEVVRLTEGTLKSDVAAALSGLPTIGAPGVTNWRPCVPLLKDLGCRVVRLAFDADSWTKPQVGRALSECYGALTASGFTVELERWDPAAGKGIDDVLLAGGSIEVLAGTDAAKAVAEAAQEEAVPEGEEPSRPGIDAIRATAEGFESYLALRNDKDFLGKLGRLKAGAPDAAADIVFLLSSKLGRDFKVRDFRDVLGRYEPGPETRGGGNADQCDKYVDTGNTMSVLVEKEIKGQIVEVPVRVCQFSGRIKREVVRHEPGGERRQYEITLRRDNGAITASATVDAKDYEAMGWVHELMGPSWVIEPDRGARDKVRAAIQVFSVRDGYETKTVSTALGWFVHRGKPIFLHGDGGIGADGATDEVGVELSPALCRYRFPDPPADAQTIREHAAAHFRILELARSERPGARGLAAILATLPCRSVLGPLDGVPHFSGGTATLKTSAARLIYQHFAIGVATRDPMLVSWGATPGSLQRYAYEAKDVCLVVDELKGEKAVATATEFVQTQGNLKARDRMDKSLRLAPSLDPRGSVISTGETDPTSQSTLGRMLIARFSHWTVDRQALGRCQADGADGKYAALMAAYIRWLASRLDDTRRRHAAKVDELVARFRAATDGATVHPRHPMLAAELAAGYRPFLWFLVQQGVINQIAAEAYALTIDGYLIELVKDQAESQQEFSPAQRFVALLLEGLRTKRFHLKSVDSDEAPLRYAGACGWHKDWLYAGGDGGRQYLDWRVPANSKMIGFIDVQAGEVYMGAESLKTVAQSVSHDQGEKYENPTKIGRDLAEAGLIRTAESKDECRLQVKKRIKDHGNARYYAIPVRHLFELEEEPDEALSVAAVPSVPSSVSQLGTLWNEATE